MRIKRSFAAMLLLLACASLAAGLAYTYRESPANYGNYPAYTKEWKQVDSAETNGLPLNALKLVTGIYNKARAENNAPQLVKAVLYRLKLNHAKEEFSEEKNIALLEKEAREAAFPAKPVLQSVLADQYWSYFESNRYTFYERTTTVNVDKEDVATWDLRSIAGRAVQLYQESLKNGGELKKIAVGEFDEIIEKGASETRPWRPTLYDLLAHRALDFFKNSEAEITKAGNSFSLNDARYLAPYPEFMELRIATPQDSLELKYYSLKLYQELLAFHKAGNNMEALADLELMRFDFLNQNSQNEIRDSLYFAGLQWMETRFKGTSRLPEIKYKMADWWADRANGYKPLEGDAHKWDRKKAVEICLAIMAENVGSRGNALARNLFNSLNERSLAITAEDVNDPGAANRALVKYTNLSRLHLKIVRSNYLQYDTLHRTGDREMFMRQLSKMPSAASFSVGLPNDEDLNGHSVEIALPPLDKGYYILIASSSENFSDEDALRSFQPLSVSNLAYIGKQLANGSEELHIVNRQSGKPLPGAEVNVWRYYYDYGRGGTVYKKERSLKAGKDGQLVLGPFGDGGSCYAQLIHDKDTLFPENSFYLYNNDRVDGPSEHSYIFTDRAIYRPGQTVYYKAVMFNGHGGSYKATPHKAVTITLYDVNEEKVSSASLVSNEYGTVSGTFILPQNGLTGTFRIANDYGDATIAVEEYKRPKFEVQFDTLKASYRLGDEITVKGLAKAFAGNSLDGATVSYRVERRVNYPVWIGWSKPWFDPQGGYEMANGTAVTNEKGEFAITFTALPDPTASKGNDPNFTFEITADVTDLNGETRSSSTRLTLGYKLFGLRFDAPENVNLEALPKMSIRATTFNGSSGQATGQLTVYRLKQPQRVFRERLWPQADKHLMPREAYYKKFPYDQYDDEANQYKWEKAGTAFTRPFNTKTDQDILIEEFKALQPGVYLAECTSKDKTGQEVRSASYITLYDPGSSKMPVQSPVWQLGLRTNVQPGEKASFIVASAYKDVYAFLGLESKAGSRHSRISPSIKPIEVPVSEGDRGGISASVIFVKNGRFNQATQYIAVPYTNRVLNVELGTFRNKLLPGQQEEWRLTVKDNKGDKIASEMVAALYDASLDALKPHSWEMNIYESFYASDNYSHSLHGLSSSNRVAPQRAYPTPVEPPTYDRLNYFDLNNIDYRLYEAYGSLHEGKGSRGGRGMATGKLSMKFEKSMVADSVKAQSGATYAFSSNAEPGGMEMVKFTPPVIKDDALEEETTGNGGKSPAEISARKNFNETAFFFPQLSTNEKGEVVIRFTMPESLTRWKLMALAHTKDMAVGQAQAECVTQKDLMVQPNAPRFLREGDQLVFSGKLANLSDKDLNGTAALHLYDALSEKEISATLLGKEKTEQTFSVKKGGSAAIEWSLSIPQGVQAVRYKITASAGNFSDGEEMTLPVLTNRMLVTESMPLRVKGGQSKEFTFTRFQQRNNNSTTLQHHAYTVEFTANPAWYAVQSLPYLMEYPYECAEQTFARYYSNALASHIVNSKPALKQVFEAWKSQGTQSFLSNLEKNQELKALLLEETPWVLQSKSESENRQRMALLFDLNHMSNELGANLLKLEKMQTSNGGWPWFSGGPEDLYITQHIVSGLGKLQKLGVKFSGNGERMKAITGNALGYCDRALAAAFNELKRKYPKYREEDHLSSTEVQYLYMRSFFTDSDVPEQTKEAFDYYKKQAAIFWLKKERQLQAMLATATHRFGDKTTSASILRTLKQYALHSEEMGMYWKENYAGYYWYQAPIEMQATMIEAFDEAGKDAASVDELRTWLIKSKQTRHWGTTRATTEAVYALLLRGGDWLSAEPAVEISLGAIKLDPKNDASLKAEAGTGYFKKTFQGSDIQPSMASIKVSKQSPGPGYGAVYWQYFEQLDKITPHATPLKLDKKLFIEKNSQSGPVMTPVTGSTVLKVGDKVKVRIELRSDRDLEYVHLKDMRASGFEPVNVLSGYRYKGGLGYYESTRDAASNFFISYLPKGTYVFEYSVYVSHQGRFSNGISSIQCMYAPEFTSHSEGIRVSVEGKK